MRYQPSLFAICLSLILSLLSISVVSASEANLDPEEKSPVSMQAGDFLVAEAIVAEPVEPPLPEATVEPPVSEPTTSEPVNQPTPPPPSPVLVDVATKLLIAGFKTDAGGANEYILIYNPNNSAVRLSSDWQLQALNQLGTSVTFSFTFSDQIVEPYSSIVVRNALLSSQMFPDLYLSSAVFSSAAGVEYKSSRLNASGAIQLVYSGQIHDQVGWNSALNYRTQPVADNGQSWQRCQIGGLALDSGNNFDDFITIEPADVTRHSLPACPLEASEPEPSAPDDTPDLKPASRCREVLISEIGANMSEQFIELHNPTSGPIDLTGCRLMTNRSQSRSYSFKAVSIPPQGYYSVRISDTDLILTKTTSGTVYLIDSDNSEVEAVVYKDLQPETSWIRTDYGWRQTYTPSPGSQNNHQPQPSCDVGYILNQDTGRCNKLASLTVAELVACAPNQYRSLETNRCRLIATSASVRECASNQYRSLETNRCRNIATATSSPAPCRAGQYRNPETNRCRNLASTTSTNLKPCAPNQSRNPDTNRCRSTTTAGSGLKPCLPNQERNPQTNRCRKVAAASIPGAGFAVEPIGQSLESRTAWWTLAGVGLAGIGYAGWQWRYELQTLIKRLLSFSSGSK